MVERALASAQSMTNASGEPLYPCLASERWRLEAALLAEGAMQPWPRTLVEMCTGTSGPPFGPDGGRRGTIEAYAALAKGLQWRDPFGIDCEVMVHDRGSS